MFNDRHYVPLLKGKNGEFGALQSMTAEEKEGITPLIEIPPIAWDHKNDSPAKTIDQHLLKVDAKFERSWGVGRAFLVDLLWVGERERMSDGTHPMACLFGRARQRGLKAIPVTGLVRGEDYQQACRNIIADDKRGVCFRLQREDFEESENLNAQIAGLLDCLRVSPAETDLLFDLGPLHAKDGEVPSVDVLSLIKAVPNLKKWRSFILGATGFPVDLMGLPPSEISPVWRSEWALWRRIATNRKAARIPTFADYAIAHPQPPEVDPRIMRPSASIRYTSDDHWLILKGKNLRDHGYRQFHDVSRSLVNSAAYSGPQFSWGDRYISECAGRRAGCGNLTTWRMVGTSHHIAFVTQQIANLSSP
jgi:hypothetical protein